MFKLHSKPRGKSPSLAEERIREVTIRLDDFFKNSNQSPEILQAIIEEYNPSLTIYESIIHIYTNSVNKQAVNRLLDKTIEYLHLNNDENLLKNPYYLKQITFHEQSHNSDLIHNTVIHNYKNIFHLLIKSNFNPNGLSSDGRTPLFTAVVVISINPIKRLEYIEQLIAHGADSNIRDKCNGSVFRCLCGIDSNYPVVYTFFRDYLLSNNPDQVQSLFNVGLAVAVYHCNVPMVTDLIKHGAIFVQLKKTDAFLSFLTSISTRILRGYNSVSLINPFILCLIQILLHNNPCENYSVCIKIFITIIYIPGVCVISNYNPLDSSYITNFKKFLFICFHYGYLTQQWANHIQTKHLPQISVTRQKLFNTLNQYFDELKLKYHRNPVSLALISIRKIRQLINNINQKKLEQLNINQHLKKMILLD